MRLKGLIDEDFINYKLPAFYLCTAFCDFKCDRESGRHCCQNSDLANGACSVLDDEVLIERYLSNPITKAIVLGGLEPFDQFDELIRFLRTLRLTYRCSDTVVIYTGYNKNEVLSMIRELEELGNIIVKFGRFVPDMEPHFDEVLGVSLASPNQYAEKIC